MAWFCRKHDFLWWAVLLDILGNGLLFKLVVVLCSPCWLYKYAHQPVLTFLLIIYSHFFPNFELDICNSVLALFCIYITLSGFFLYTISEFSLHSLLPVICKCLFWPHTSQTSWVLVPFSPHLCCCNNYWFYYSPVVISIPSLPFWSMLVWALLELC
jgi:hypothetical protein